MPDNLSVQQMLLLSMSVFWIMWHLEDMRGWLRFTVFLSSRTTYNLPYSFLEDYEYGIVNKTINKEVIYKTKMQNIAISWLLKCENLVFCSILYQQLIIFVFSACWSASQNKQFEDIAFGSVSYWPGGFIDKFLIKKIDRAAPTTFFVC